MTSWYLEWVSQYLIANDANTATNQALLKAWWRGFEAMRATQAELGQATFDVLSLEKRPVRLADHFAAIRTAIINRRSDAAKNASEDYTGPDLGRCTKCGSTGWVTVPHAKYANAEGWRPRYSSGREQWPTMAVLCDCGKGRRFAELQTQQDQHLRATTIETYQQMHNSEWREQMREQRERNQAVERIEVSIDPRAILERLSQAMASNTKGKS